MQSDSGESGDTGAENAGDKAPEVEAEEGTPAARTRSDAYRERFRQAQLIAAQVAKARTAGAQPSEDEAARLVAEFHAKGGRVTVVPSAEEVPPEERGRGARDKPRQS